MPPVKPVLMDSASDSGSDTESNASRDTTKERRVIGEKAYLVTCKDIPVK